MASSSAQQRCRGCQQVAVRINIHSQQHEVVHIQPLMVPNHIFMGLLMLNCRGCRCNLTNFKAECYSEHCEGLVGFCGLPLCAALFTPAINPSHFPCQSELGCRPNMWLAYMTQLLNVVSHTCAMLMSSMGPLHSCMTPPFVSTAFATFSAEPFVNAQTCMDNALLQ